MKTADGREYSYRTEELETIIRYDAVDKMYHVRSNIKRDVKEMKAKGWVPTHESEYEVSFLMPRHAIKFMPAEKKKRQLSEKQREALAKNGFGARRKAGGDVRDIIADETPHDEG